MCLLETFASVSKRVEQKNSLFSVFLKGINVNRKAMIRN